MTPSAIEINHKSWCNTYESSARLSGPSALIYSCSCNLLRKFILMTNDIVVEGLLLKGLKGQYCKFKYHTV